MVKQEDKVRQLLLYPNMSLTDNIMKILGTIDGVENDISLSEMYQHM